MRRISAGEQAALRSVYQLHHVRVHRYLMSLLRDGSAAEDVLAEVFLDVWRQAGSFAGRSSLNTWLCGIARNKAMAYRRKYQPAQDPTSLEEEADESELAEITLQKAEKGAQLKACIAMLGPEHREVIHLVYYQDMSIEDVSKTLDIPLNTVKTRMFYARKKLSEIMAARGIDRGWP